MCVRYNNFKLQLNLNKTTSTLWCLTLKRKKKKSQRKENQTGFFCERGVVAYSYKTEQSVCIKFRTTITENAQK